MSWWRRRWAVEVVDIGNAGTVYVSVKFLIIIKRRGIKRQNVASDLINVTRLCSSNPLAIFYMVLLFSSSCYLFLFVFLLQSLALSFVPLFPMFHLAVTVAIMCRVALLTVFQWTSCCFMCTTGRTTGKGGCCFSFHFI